MTGARIHLAFRFHANFVHSYRGDTPDESGFGQDIRIVRHLIDVLDRAEELGLHVPATWDVDNAFTLEEVMPRHCPDLLEAWQRRVTRGSDEMALMSYNNGLVTTHTPAEFDAAISDAISNERGSGIRDLFGVTPRVVRPQEMMITPKHLELYPAHGVDVVSLYYSGVPFNAFSNFVEPLTLVERFNPLTLSMSGTDATMTLLPAVNHGDIAEQVSLRGWLRRLRRAQLRLAHPTDLLVLVDADADDEFWVGYGTGRIRAPLGAARGLAGLLASVRELDFVEFTTPERYLADHPPVGRVTFGQDTADGSFDGYASWAEKWSSTRLWTGVQRSRQLEAHSVALTGRQPPTPVAELLDRSRRARLRAMSTTNYGLSSPVVLDTRLASAEAEVDEAVDAAATALARCLAEVDHGHPPQRDEPAPLVLHDTRDAERSGAEGPSTAPVRRLVRIPLADVADDVADPLRDVMQLEDGTTTIATVGRRTVDGGDELLVPCELRAGDRLRLRPARAAPGRPVRHDGHPVQVDAEGIGHHGIEVRTATGVHRIVRRRPDGDPADEVELRSAVTLGRRSLEVERWTELDRGVSADRSVGWSSWHGVIDVLAAHVVHVRRDYLVVAGLDAVVVDTLVSYPDTTGHPGARVSGTELGGPHDTRWREVMPCELRPLAIGSDGRSIRVWKQSAHGDVSSYELGSIHGGTRRGLDSVNNHVTDSWVAVSDGRSGVLVAQGGDWARNFAFCPLRSRRRNDGTDQVRLNPFGAYTGRQLRYRTAGSRIGRVAALAFASSCRSPAPSFMGHDLRFSLFVAPYPDDAPPDGLQQEAHAFSCPPLQLFAGATRAPGDRDWRASAPR